MKLEPRNIYFDVTTLVENPFTDGIRRASKSWFKGLIELSIIDKTFRIVPCRSYDSDLRIDYSCVGRVLGNTDIEMSCNEEWQSGTLFIPSYDSFVREKNVNFDYIASQVSIVSTIYDLLPFDYPEWFPSLEVVDRFKEAIYLQCFYSSKIVVNTKHVKQRLQSQMQTWNMDFSQKEIVVIPLGGLPAIEEKQGLFENSPRYVTNFLVVGTIEPRKGVGEVLTSFLNANPVTNEIGLTLVGRLGWNVSHELTLIRQAKKRFPHNFRWLNNVADEELEMLYSQADVCIFASYDEGFGLPLIESLDRGKICIARNIPPFIEITNHSVVTFGNGGDFENLADGILNYEKICQIAKSRRKNYKHVSSEMSTKMLLRHIATV